MAAAQQADQRQLDFFALADDDLLDVLADALA
jgi:hypothetical protein